MKQKIIEYEISKIIQHLDGLSKEALEIVNKKTKELIEIIEKMIEEK